MKYRIPVVLLCVCGGCADSDSTTSQPPADTRSVEQLQPSPDNVEAVAALEALGAEFKRNDNGNITEVNLRDTPATDDALQHVAALEKVASVLLNDLPITDDGLAHLAEWKAPVGNLDLRGCSVSNDGLAYLKSLKSLKAIRLNGTSGATTVDDGGLQHLVDLTNLKVLALDGLWVSEVGLESLDRLVNLEELYLKSTTISDEGLRLLARYPKLKKLRLAFNQISDAGPCSLIRYHYVARTGSQRKRSNLRHRLGASFCSYKPEETQPVASRCIRRWRPKIGSAYQS